MNRIRSAIWLTLVITFLLPSAAFAAQSSFGVDLWRVLQRIIVIVGATLVLGLWQAWRERRNKNKE